MTLGRPVEPPLVMAFQYRATGLAIGASEKLSREKSGGRRLGAFQSASPPTTSAGFRISSTAAASPRGSRHDSEVGVAPHFHTAKEVSKNALPLGKPIATKSPGLTPLAMNARARRLAPRSSASHVGVSCP